MIIPFIPLQCGNCKNFIGAHNLKNAPKDTEPNIDVYCTAFPFVIPGDIQDNTFKHDKKHPDQKNDIIFEPEGEEKTQ